MTVAAYQISGDVLSLPADLDLSASQYCGVAVNSDGEAILPTGAGASIVGVLQNDPDAAGKAADIKIYGASKMKLGGSVTKGDKVKVDTSGRAVTASAGDVAIGAAIGVCLVGGATNNIGTVLLHLHGEGTTLLGGDETVTTGALSAYADTSYLSVTGTVAFTLPDGLYDGQKKRVKCTVAATNPLGTLTITSALAGQSTTHVFTAVGQQLFLEWNGAAWEVTGKLRTGDQAVVVGTTILTGYDMAGRYNLSVTGTVVSDSTKSIPNGTVPGEMIDVQVTTAADTPAGEIGITAVDLDNAAKTKIDDIDGTTSHHAQLRWDGAAWQTVSITGLALA